MVGYSSEPTVDRLIGHRGESSEVLVGRDRELATIATAMTLVRDAQRVVHLVGEPGIGKTTLAGRVSALAAAQGWTVAWGRTWNAASASPYWPWQQVLGSLFRATGIAERCHRATLAWLVELCPGVAGLADGPPPTLDPDRARAALLRAVVHVLETAAADRPLMVVLDDVHAADAASLELAALVAGGLPNSPVLLLTSQRPMGSAADSVGPRWLGELNRQGTVLPVGPLDRAAVAAQAAALTGRDPTAGEVVQLYRASGGNPFFVEQLLRWSPGGTRVAVSGGLPVSAAVLRLVGERLAALSVDARWVVTVAAVAGDVVDERVLAAVADLPPARYADAVDAAVAAGILWRGSAEPPECGFVHALLREAAKTVQADQRRGLHHRVAVALESLPCHWSR